MGHCTTAVLRDLALLTLGAVAGCEVTVHQQSCVAQAIANSKKGVAFCPKAQPCHSRPQEVLNHSDHHPVLFLSNLVEGTYTFHLKVTDAKGESDTDRTTVEVKPGELRLRGLHPQRGQACSEPYSSVSGRQSLGPAPSPLCMTDQGSMGSLAQQWRESQCLISMEMQKTVYFCKLTLRLYVTIQEGDVGSLLRVSAVNVLLKQELVFVVGKDGSGQD